jgi:hypothetical protein
LCVRVDGNEFNALHLGVDHVIHGIVAGATATNHADASEGLDFWFYTL